MKLNKLIGSTMLIIGTAIGAGMLALPMVSAGAGFGLTAILTVVTWALTTMTALLLLEVTLAFKPYHNNFSTMAQATLGSAGKIFTWITCLLLLYSLTAAYIAGNSSLLTSLFAYILHVNIPNWVNALLFTVLLGGIVYWSTKAVDYLNRSLLSIKGLLLIGALFLLLPQIKFSILANAHVGTKYLWAAMPIFLCSFGFHNVIPSLTNYVGPKAKEMKIAIIFGTTITLILYLLWLLATLGTIPLEGNSSFAMLSKDHGSVGQFIEILATIVNNKWVTFGVNGFANIAMTTSFLGVSLGLFDFLADGCKRPNTRSGRLQTAFMTFIPPLIFALFFPEGFIIALGYAAIFVAILVIILPALMVYKLRKNNTLPSTYRAFGGNILLMTIICIGVGLIILQIFVSLHMLPTLK